MDVAIVMGLFGVLGLLIGYRVGSVLGARAETDRSYRIRNVLVVLVGIVLSAIVSAIGFLSLGALALGLMGGAIAGLKMGYGKSVGMWERHDRAFRVNADHVAAAESQRAAAEDGMTGSERASRVMVSVPDDERSA